MDLDLPGLSTLAPKVPSCMVYKRRCQVHVKFHNNDMRFARPMI